VEECGAGSEECGVIIIFTGGRKSPSWIDRLFFVAISCSSALTISSASFNNCKQKNVWLHYQLHVIDYILTNSILKRGKKSMNGKDKLLI